MSRGYRFQVEAKEWTGADNGVLALEGAEVSDTDFYGERHVIEGEIRLCGGESPDEAHERFTKALGRKINTRWLFLDVDEWDDEFEDLEDSIEF